MLIKHYQLLYYKALSLDGLCPQPVICFRTSCRGAIPKANEQKTRVRKDYTTFLGGIWVIITLTLEKGHPIFLV